MGTHPLSFDQVRELLGSLEPGSPYRLVIVTCQQPGRCARLIAAWLPLARLQVVRLDELVQEIDLKETVNYQEVAIAKLNQLAESKDHLALVVEDFEQFDDQVVQSFTGWLINYLPPNLTVVLAGARLPRLILSRLRVRRALLEMVLSVE